MERPVVDSQVRLTLLDIICSVEQGEHQQPGFALKDVLTNYLLSLGKKNRTPHPLFFELSVRWSTEICYSRL